jgi:D-tyrosyl-tRNA(Tyr) deacylase|tara:strand:- start:34549 stop:34995 length:447 start_codon:yes stop_codon:yes gene_type:complete
MIAVLQRVSNASVSVDGNVVGKIDKGLLIFLGVFKDDNEEDINFLSEKIPTFRIFKDEKNKMNLSLIDVNGEVLVVSQFTLCGNWQKGRRPSFLDAAKPVLGNQLYEKFVEKLKNFGGAVETGKFGAMMDVSLTNDGPVTFVMDSKIK